VEFEIKTDSSGQKYIEVETVKGKESLRISYIEDGFVGEPCIRLNIRPHGSPLRQGPEFPVGKVPELLAGIAQLLIENSDK
jgi:hypothetical protein